MCRGVLVTLTPRLKVKNKLDQERSIENKILNLCIIANTHMKDTHDLSECSLTEVCNEMAQEIADTDVYNRALQAGYLIKATASQRN